MANLINLYLLSKEIYSGTFEIIILKKLKKNTTKLIWESLNFLILLKIAF